jgi:hypothetical protein
MAEETTQVTAPAPERPEAVKIIDRVSQAMSKNFPAIVEKASKLKAALSALKTIADDKSDAWAEQALVKGKTALDDIDKLRKEITKPLDTFKAAVMGPEKALEEELVRIRSLRNAYANEKNAKANEEKKRIEKEKLLKIHEAEIKAEMKAAIEYGIAQRLQSLEKTVADLFEKMSLDEGSQFHFRKVAAALGFKPALKADFIDTVFATVKYNPDVMTREQFDDLIKRAKDYAPWKFEELDAHYRREGLAVASRWREKLQPRIKDLEAIAAGGDKAEKAKARVESANAQAKEQIQTQEKQTAQAIESTKNSEKQEGTLNAEFNAQVQAQDIQEVAGRKKKIYRLDPKIEKDFVKVSGIIGKVALNVLTEEGRKSVHVLDENGYPKRDDKGDPIYIPGIAYWLKELAGLGYAPQIEGLVLTEEIVTVAKAK